MYHIYSIEGNIGSGKSTLVRRLQQMNSNIVFMLEPVDEWGEIKDRKGENILTKFYKDQVKYSFSFQMMAYISRLSKLKKIIKKNPYSIIITERSVLTDKNVFAKMLYDDDKIEEVNYIIYLKWFDEFIKDISHTGFIYIQVDPEICHERVEKRNRIGETISVEYLKKCHDYHEKWLKKEENVLFLNGNVDFETDNNQMEIINQQINTFITQKSICSCIRLMTIAGC